MFHNEKVGPIADPSETAGRPRVPQVYPGAGVRCQSAYFAGAGCAVGGKIPFNRK
jgi:hypothetical protein